MPLYPFLLEPIYKEKVWGGESWELADLDSTSESGGGGGAAHSRIRNGPLAKRTLGEVVKDFGPLVLGDVPLTSGGNFPLLVKYLDARESLSVQVHPSPAYAAAHPDAHLKSEAWYVVRAEPGAVIYKGVVEGTKPDDFAEAIRCGTVEDLMIEIPVRPGDCHYLPSGTCHALGGGIVVAEVQTPSDTTFRVFDWGRTDRELHIEQALESIEFGPVRTGVFEPVRTETREGVVERVLVQSPHFAMSELAVSTGARETLPTGEPVVLMIVHGCGVVRWGGDGDRRLIVGPGQTLLLPSSVAAATLYGDDDMTVLRITIPIE